jgi:hypothetical protein
MPAAARSAIAFRDDAARREDVRATTGRLSVSPGIVTAFNGDCEITLDQRALDPAFLQPDALRRGAAVARQRGDVLADAGCLFPR